MLRDKSLIPLSHQHQHALALCVRIDRASPIRKSELVAWQEEVAEIARTEIGIHFAAEEQVLFPAACRFNELDTLVEDLVADHVWLRERFAQAEAQTMSAEHLSAFALRLSAHIRKEERGLFDRLQQLMTGEELTTLGKDLETALKKASRACLLPSEITRLRPAK